MTGDLIDRANDLVEMQRAQAVAKAIGKTVQPALLEEDKGSLERYCYDCDAKIPEARLRILPESTLCVECTERREKAYL